MCVCVRERERESVCVYSTISIEAKISFVFAASFSFSAVRCRAYTYIHIQYHPHTQHMYIDMYRCIVYSTHSAQEFLNIFLMSSASLMKIYTLLRTTHTNIQWLECVGMRCPLPRWHL